MEDGGRAFKPIKKARNVKFHQRRWRVRKNPSTLFGVMEFFCTFVAILSLKADYMTQEEAVKKALLDLGGRASLKQIYEIAQKYVTFGTHTPEASIRSIIYRSKEFIPDKDKHGWVEHISYQETIAKLKKENAEKDILIKELFSQLSTPAIFESLANAYMDASMGKDKEDRKSVRDTLKKIQSSLNINLSDKLHQRIESFGKDIPMAATTVGDNNTGIIVGGNLHLKILPHDAEHLIEGLLGNKH